MWTRALVVFLAAASVTGITRDQFYPYGSGLDTILPIGSEVASPEIKLSVPIIFYGEEYDSIYVNNYGVLTFRGELNPYLNTEFPLPFASIAAFYADIDTTQSGSIYYRESNEPHVLAKATESVQDNFHNYYEFQPKSVFIATWVEVAYKNSGRPDKKNSFQIAIISNGNESFVEFLYPEKDIQWIQGDEIANEIQAKAQAGFVAEDGRLYLLRGSGTQQIRNIISWSNIHDPGRYLYRIGRILNDGNIIEPDQYDQNEVEIEEESKTCALSGHKVCHIQAKCVDYQAGICCQCNEGFYGNGKTCVQVNVPIRVLGKVSGALNDISLDEATLEAYVVLAEGRAYTAISNSPQQLGNSLQLLQVLGGVMGWMFAIPAGNAKNGYQLTGAVFNHSVEILFSSSGDKVAIRQEYTGHNAFDHVILETDIRGSIPIIPSGAKLEISEYEELYNIVEPGLIKSDSLRVIRNKVTNSMYEMRISETITYNACKNAPASDELSTIVKVSKTYLGYEENQNIVRYGQANKIYPIGQEDPCFEGKNVCGAHSACISQGDSFVCSCHSGYTSIYLNDGKVCVDIDECDTRTHNCDSNAECLNQEGGFQCRCRTGYVGNGISCTLIAGCDNKCDQDAECVENYGRAICVCKNGFTGDGTRCWPVNQYTCDTVHNCSPYGSCIYIEYSETFSCACNEGYSGDGYYCSRELPTTQLPPVTTLANIEQEYNDTYVLPICSDSSCQCPPGYVSFRDSGNNDLCKYDGYWATTPSDSLNDPSIPCTEDQDCPPNAQCALTSNASESSLGHCVCLEGYEGDAYECIEKAIFCGPKASRAVNAADEEVCLCNLGYHGDGYICKPNFTCNNNSDCEFNAECKRDYSTGDFVCQCVNGYINDENDACIPDRLCSGASCAEHASCLYDSHLGIYYCHCGAGYEGDGITQCSPPIITCNEVNNCSNNAMCTLKESTYQCICIEGYIGDGYNCNPDYNCKIDPFLCDAHASCLKRSDGYGCECNNGYNGNGSVCVLDPKQSGNFLVASDGVFIYRVPLQKSAKDIIMPINNAIDQIAVGIDVDCRTGQIYWADFTTPSIKRAAYDGSSFEIFLADDIKGPEGVAIDWSARNIFWTDSRKLTIEVANIDTRIRKVLFANERYANLRGIAVHPRRGKIFWSDWNRTNPKIEWANMDGSQRGTFLDRSDVQLPNSLAIDWVRDRLCYADAGLHKIECIDIDSREKEVIARDCSYPFVLAIHGDKFYWSDWTTRAIEYIDSRTQIRGQVPINTSSKKLYGVAIAQDQCPMSDNVCQFRNGNCQPDQLCLPDGRGSRTCVTGSFELY